MTENEFVHYFPELYHVAAGGSWQSIRRFGLESTSALLDRFGKSGPERNAIESQRRAKDVALEHAEFGSAVIRDQAPIAEGKLARCLEGMTTAEWYRMLNGYVFLWPSGQRRDRMLGSYENRFHDVLTIDSEKLLGMHGDSLRLSPINTGSTQYNPARRGRDTFVSLQQCPFSEWRRRRKKPPQEVVAEVVIVYRLTGVESVLRRVESYFGRQPTGDIWRAPA